MSALQKLPLQNTLIDALQWRHAVREFSESIIPDHELQPLLDALQLSPSSYGLQPFRVLMIDDLDLRNKMVPHAMSQEKVEHCSHLLVLAAQTDVGDHIVDQYAERAIRDRNEAVPVGYLDHMKSVLQAMNSEQKLEWAHQQSYVALGNLLTSAALLGIDACPIGGIDPKGIDNVLQLEKEHLTTSVLCALGRRASQTESVGQTKIRLSLDELILRR